MYYLNDDCTGMAGDLNKKRFGLDPPALLNIREYNFHLATLPRLAF
jgi:hypothetical protein